MLPSITATPLRSGDILVVDDSAKDVRLIREVLREQGLKHRLHIAHDGGEALRMLRRQPPHDDLPSPDLVLLDINLPTLSGVEVLESIKQDPELRMLPVLMLSTSRADSDVSACYARHANGYLVKPSNYDEFADLMQLTLRYWLERTQPPPRPTVQ